MILAPGPLNGTQLGWWPYAAAWSCWISLVLWALWHRSRLWNSCYVVWNQLCKWLWVRWESRPSRVNRGLLTTAYYLERMAGGPPLRKPADDA